MRYIVFILLLFMSCTKQDIEPVFDIKETVLKEEPTPNRAFDNITYYANQHVSNHGYITYPMNQWSKTVVFTPSCRYECIDPLNQDDWNKLFGVRKNAIEQFKNGAYLVWCYVPYSIIQGDTIIDKIRIGWYLHNNAGNFDLMPLTETIYVNIGVPVSLYLRNFQTYFIYNLNGQAIYINKADYNILNFSNGWRLSPNSGGDETQDHNMVIQYN